MTRKKMSKSKGNVVTPLGLLEEHGSDAVRYWAARGGPGADTAFDTGQMRVGRRLAIKLLNASKFVLARSEPAGPVVTTLDRGMLARLSEVVGEATDDLEGYNYTRALERVESFFWWFCDNYLELVKARRYGDRGDALAASANGAMRLALSAVLRLLAVYLPFTTAEVWSWWRSGSVHRAAWPTRDDVLAPMGAARPRDLEALDLATDLLAEIRRVKSEAQVPLRTPVAALGLTAPAEVLTLFSEIADDVCAAGLVARVDVAEGARRVVVDLASPEPVNEAGA